MSSRSAPSSGHRPVDLASARAIRRSDRVIAHGEPRGRGRLRQLTDAVRARRPSYVGVVSAGGSFAGGRGALRVVECGSGVSAAYAAKLLADVGADVVKVEPPGGDTTRW